MGREGTAGRLVYLLGLLVFAALQGALVIYPALFQPRFPVDTYGYIAKAQQLQTCPRQDCPALVDLRQQVQPTGDPEVDWERNRAYHRGLYIYHPLHSAVLLGLRGILPSWEAAWLALTIVGEILVIGSIAYFVHAAWAPLAGGITLLILAPTLFSGYHGLHTLVPSNLALAIGFLTWGLILSGRRGMAFILPIAVAAMVSMHAVGQLYAGITILLYLAIMDRRAPATWLALAAAGGVLLIYLALPHLIDRPALDHWQHPPPADWSFWPAFRESLREAWAIVETWALRFGGPVPALLLTAIGLAAAPRWRSGQRLMLGAILALVTFASAFHLLPRYPAELFSRAWIPLAVFINGAIACAWLVWLRAGSTLHADWRSGPAAKDRLTPLFQDRGRPAIGFTALGLLVVFGLVLNGALIAWFFPNLTTYVHDFQERRMALDTGQPPAVLAGMRDDQAVVFMDEMPMYFYLSHGALQRSTVYYPGIEGSADEQELLDEDIGMVISMVTGDRYKKDMSLDFGLPSFNAGLPIEDNAVIRLSGADGRAWRKGGIRLANAGDQTTLQVTAIARDGDAQASWTMDVPAAWEGWVPLAAPSASDARTLAIQAIDDDRLLVTGIGVDQQSRLNWPWDQGISVEYVYGPEQLRGAEANGPAEKDTATIHRPGATDRDGEADDPDPPSSETIRFESSALIPDRCRSRGVVADGGATVAIAVRCGDG